MLRIAAGPFLWKITGAKFLDGICFIYANYRRYHIPGGYYFFLSICWKGIIRCWLITLIYCWNQYVYANNKFLFISMSGWCCRSLCIASGHYRKVMMIFPIAEKWSKLNSQRIISIWTAFQSTNQAWWTRYLAAPFPRTCDSSWLRLCDSYGLTSF